MNDKDTECDPVSSRGLFDIIVVGAGHAGCEAALAAARLGKKTLLLTMQLESVAMMPCNPSIGGTGKGQLVKEIDALGGEMGLLIDRAFLQSRMLNRSKGPAVFSPRAQADKQRYHEEMLKVLEGQENLTLRCAEVTDLLTEESVRIVDNCAIGRRPPKTPSKMDVFDEPARRFWETRKTRKLEQLRVSTKILARGTVKTFPFRSKRFWRPMPDRAVIKICGVVLSDGEVLRAGVVILATGTYLNGLVHISDRAWPSGPSGLRASTALPESLKRRGFPLRRFKTGTPARVAAGTLNYSEMREQPGDEPVEPFSFLNEGKDIGGNRLPCWLTYTNPEGHRIVQENIKKTAPYGGYTTGVGPRYCLSIEDKVSRFPERARHQVFLEPEGEGTEDVYIQGVSTSLPEPIQELFYKSITGLENAVITKYGYSIEYDCVDPLSLEPSLAYRGAEGLYLAGQINGTSGYEEAAAQGLIAGVNAARALDGLPPWTPDRSEAYIGVLIDDLVTKGTDEPYRIMTSRAEFRLVLRQDNADLRLTAQGRVLGLASEERHLRCEAKRRAVEMGDLAGLPEELIPACRREREIMEKYAGYIAKQQKQIEKFRRLEGQALPADLDYESMEGLRIEARLKLGQIRPVSLGQAARISGVSPADISVLMVYLRKR